MAHLVEKRIQITDNQASRLEQLARMRGVTESTLVEQGLNLLFREQGTPDNSTDSLQDALQDDWAQLREWEAEFGPLNERGPARKIYIDEITSVVSTPVDASRIRRIGELP